ncbi:ankyrin [Lophiostoma macrostomum CBS 122681]|uniref:Ankyrin n=1 Tax=Lophiostoma macrostomum CBS 122681 TaxID=1314788 RepID=A0A6A6SW72_9PLEO|nr:ankyrin [Lophiostoma macrostomum CBS 122681]
MSSRKSMLLDLPTELFTPIILDVIGEVGLAEAWKLRRVCKTFRGYIEDEILTNTPMSAFKDNDGTSRIVSDNVRQCLIKRCLSVKLSLEANAFPYFLVQLVEKLLQYFPPENWGDIDWADDIREAYIIDLIDMILSNNDGKHLFGSSFKRHLEWSFVECSWQFRYNMATSPLREIDLMVAACAVGNAPAVKYFLKVSRAMSLKSGRLLFDQFTQNTFLHRLPLEAAVANSKLDIVALLLDHFKLILEKNPSWYSRDRTYRSISIHDGDGDKIFMQVADAIDKAIVQRKAKELRLLLEFEFENYSDSQYRVSQLVESTVNARSLELLKVVCSFKNEEYNPHNCEHWWEPLCLSTEYDIIRYLLENQIVTVGVHTPWYRGTVTPLHWVAQSGQGETAKILVEHGADINCRNAVRVSWTATPLKTAAYFGNIGVARTLIELGANVYYGSPLTAVFNCKRRARHTQEVYEMTRLLLDHGTPVNQRVAWDVELNAMHEVSSGMRWVEGKTSPDLVMGIIAGAAALKAKVPRRHIPKTDFQMSAMDARKLIVDGNLEWSVSCNKIVARCWPNLFFTSRVLRKVVKGSLKKSIPAQHRKQMVAVARNVLSWLEGRRN